MRLFNDAEYFEVPMDDGSGLSVVPAAYASGMKYELQNEYFVNNWSTDVSVSMIITFHPCVLLTVQFCT